MEFHPIIDQSTVIDSPRIILGSFPTWSISKPDTREKQIKRNQSGDLNFFYGSSRNLFWNWYQTFIDQDISINKVEDIRNSLSENNIGITDTIIKCKRKGSSASDSDLSCRTYHHDFFQIPTKGKKLKILCTSKGVLNEMFLSKSFFEKHPEMHLDIFTSKEIQNECILDVGGNPDLISKPVCIVVKVSNAGSFECMALPSPGSPYRGLKHFCFYKGKAENYLNNYLKYTFDWFIS